MNKKIILATVATIAAAGAVQGVYADEVQGATTTGDGASATVKKESQDGYLIEFRSKQYLIPKGAVKDVE